MKIKKFLLFGIFSFVGLFFATSVFASNGSLKTHSGISFLLNAKKATGYYTYPYKTDYYLLPSYNMNVVLSNNSSLRSLYKCYNASFSMIYCFENYTTIKRYKISEKTIDLYSEDVYFNSEPGDRRRIVTYYASENGLVYLVGRNVQYKDLKYPRNVKSLEDAVLYYYDFKTKIKKQIDEIGSVFNYIGVFNGHFIYSDGVEWKKYSLDDGKLYSVDVFQNGTPLAPSINQVEISLLPRHDQVYVKDGNYPNNIGETYSMIDYGIGNRIYNFGIKEQVEFIVASGDSTNINRCTKDDLISFSYNGTRLDIDCSPYSQNLGYIKYDLIFSSKNNSGAYSFYIQNRYDVGNKLFLLTSSNSIFSSGQFVPLYSVSEDKYAVGVFEGYAYYRQVGMTALKKKKKNVSENNTAISDGSSDDHSSSSGVSGFGADVGNFLGSKLVDFWDTMNIKVNIDDPKRFICVPKSNYTKENACQSCSEKKICNACLNTGVAVSDYEKLKKSCVSEKSEYNGSKGESYFADDFGGFKGYSPLTSLKSCNSSKIKAFGDYFDFSGSFWDDALGIFGGVYDLVTDIIHILKEIMSVFFDVFKTLIISKDYGDIEMLTVTQIADKSIEEIVEVVKKRDGRLYFYGGSFDLVQLPAELSKKYVSNIGGKFFGGKESEFYAESKIKTKAFILKFAAYFIKVADILASILLSFFAVFIFIKIKEDVN